MVDLTYITICNVLHMVIPFMQVSINSNGNAADTVGTI